MHYMRLGKTGLQVSRLCLGCMTFGEPLRGPHEWTLDEEKTRPVLVKAIGSGINFFDTANIIGACKASHLDDAVAALELELTPQEIARLEAPYIPHPVTGIS